MSEDQPKTLNLSTEKLPSLLQDLIYGLKIRDVMSTRLITAMRQDSLRSIQKLMKENKITGVPIVENKRLFGIISVDDILNALSNGFIDDAAEIHMTRNVIVLEDDMPLSLAISYFEKYRFGRFPVLNKDNTLVGIIASRDILNKLLVEMNKEVLRIENQLPTTPPSSHLHQAYKEFYIQKFDFENAGKASGEIKKILQAKGLSAKIIRRAAVAAYELEMNLAIHSDGGKIKLIADDQHLEISAVDRGPGISNIELALKEGYSTANDWIRSLGFGAGIGLANVKRVSDQFHIESALDKGTQVIAAIDITGGQDETK
jgi:CBS domain-containing protein/anti-sigma regulatory factor (Ser/Thr protein kinase)